MVLDMSFSITCPTVTPSSSLLVTEFNQTSLFLTFKMRYISTLLVLLATSTSLMMAMPTPQVVNEDANERADDGSKAVENELKIQESIALQQAGCFGGVIEGAACEKIDKDFQDKIAKALGTDDAAAADAAKADAAKADAGKDKAAASKDNAKKEN
ncbi:hypothetical protein GQ53DRAFT_761675 [Thozetella sp. PMI_491]|nr:hypothetical protein GQ53DRAFT_761675 [Thozetella sp. PMI_491]